MENPGDPKCYTSAPTTSTGGADILTLVSVPARISPFTMDNTNIELTHTVASITAFAIAKYEVQYADWVTVKTWATANGYTITGLGVQGSDGLQTDQHPVTNISWRDAIVWCNAASEKQGLTPVYFTDAGFTIPLKASTNTGSVNATAGSEDNPYVNWSANGYRLPTEAEWEYAARYRDGITFAPGDAPSGWQDTNTDGLVDTAENDAVAWYNSGPASTSPVGTKAANALGLFDMSGNVWEWTWDWYGAYTAAPPYTDADSKGPATGVNRVNRGGSWSDSASTLRAAYRVSYNPWGTTNGIGFRPVRRP